MSIIDNIIDIYSDTSIEYRKKIAEKFIPTINQKNKNAEIPTTNILIDKILDKIPDEYWKKPHKIIEPCCGKGNIVLGIFDKYFKGLNEYIPDEIERCRVIIEECIYICDIEPINIYTTKLLLSFHAISQLKKENWNNWINVLKINNFKYNSYIGDTLKLNIKKKWNIDSFDIHICNPPYEENINGIRKALNHNLWSVFLKWSYNNLKDNGILAYITPTSWMSPTNKNKNIFYNNHIIYLNINECKKYFNIGSTFSYYIIKKTNNIGSTIIDCEYKNKIYNSICNLNNMEYLPNFTNKDTINIIKKFKFNNLPKISFKTTCELHNTSKKDKLSLIKDDKYIYETRHTAKNLIKYSSHKHSLYNKCKILLCLSGNLMPYYDNGNMGITQAQMYLLTDNENYINILNSNLYKFIFNICKWSGFNIEKIYHNIPYIDSIKTNNEIYKIFKLTNNEIKLILNNI